MARILWNAQYHVACTAAAMPIALELTARGHEVVVLAAEPAAARFTGMGLGFRRSRRFPAYDFSQRANSSPLPEGEGSPSDRFRRWWRQLVGLQLDDTWEVLSSEPYDLVLGGSCMMLCGHGFAAERSGIPWASYVDLLLDETGAMGDEFPARWDRLRASVGLPPESRPPSQAPWFPLSPQLTLLLTLPELQVNRAPTPGYVHRVGAAGWEAPASHELPAWFHRLGRQRPAVLVSTSSLWQEDLDLVVTAAEALAEEGIDIVATVAADHDVPPLPRDVIVTRYFPHSLLMPRVRAVVCSAGLGTVTQAAWAGVPVVAVPRSGDAHQVAEAVAQTGMGIALRARDLTGPILRDAVARALTDRTMIAAAARLGLRARRYAPVTTSVGLLETLL